jgi:hypothetical protein
MGTANLTPAAVITGEHGMILLQGDYDTGQLNIDGALYGLTPASWAELKEAGDSVLLGVDAVRSARLAVNPNPGSVPDSVAGTPFPGRPGYVTGTCGHAVAGSEWDAGYRKCEGC